jgi:hypothetical protein
MPEYAYRRPQIVLRGVSVEQVGDQFTQPPDPLALLSSRMQQIECAGFVNYFGPQRIGVGRKAICTFSEKQDTDAPDMEAGGYLVGLRLIQNDFKGRDEQFSVLLLAMCTGTQEQWMS